MKRRLKPIEYSLIAIPILGGCLMFFNVATVFQNSFHPFPDSERETCFYQLARIGLAFAQYTQDYDEKLPLNQELGKGQQGWHDELQPYNRLKSYSTFQCPSAYHNPRKEVQTETRIDYWFNSNLAGKRITNFDTNCTLLAGDGESEQTSNYALKALPPSWRMEDSSPANRHFGEANYVLLDGRVEGISAETIDDFLNPVDNARRTLIPRKISSVQKAQNKKPTPKAAQSKTTSEPR